MSEQTANAGAGAGSAGGRPKSPGIDDTLRELNAARRETVGAARGTVDALRQLARSDFELARGALGRSLAWGAVAALLGCSAWLLLTAVLVAAVNALGLDWVWSLLVVAAVYLLVAGLCAWRMSGYLEHIGMRATRRQLARLGERTSPPPAAAAAAAAPAPPTAASAPQGAV